MKPTRHDHPCVHERHGCKGTVPCSGELSLNHDGFPTVCCSDFHRCDGTIDAQPCSDCVDDTCLACLRVVRWEGHEEGCNQQLERELSPAESEHAVTEAFARVLKAKP